MHITDGLNVADLLGVIAGAGFVGGLCGYAVAAVRQAMGLPPHFNELVMHFSMIPGIGMTAFIVFDLLAIH